MSPITIPSSFTLEEMQHAFRTAQTALASPTRGTTQNTDLRGLRATNAGASVNATDYTTRAEVQTAIANLKAYVDAAIKAASQTPGTP